MTVYVVQQQMTFDKNLGELVPKFPGIFKAERWGELVYLLSPTASPFNAAAITRELKQKLATFCDEDYIVLIGNPTLIGIASAVAAQANNGRVKCLQWSARQKEYAMIFFTIA